MATLISRATGNFTTAGTWEVVDTTSYLDSSAASTAIGTSNVDSSTFTPGAITVSGIALKIANRAASPSGTFTVTLRNSTGGVDVIAVTVNVSDLPYYASTSRGFGWVFFKFATPQLLVVATAYLVRCVCSASGSQVTLYRNGTSNNHSRMLATTTTGAPASGDQLMFIGERTGAGTGNAFTVTMDNTATTSFGPTVSGGPPEGVVIGQGGTFDCGTTAATNYYFKWKGILHICSGGLMQVGTVGTPIPSTSTCTLFGDSAANVDSGIVNDSGGTLTIQGATKNPWTNVTADAASSATVITLASTSGWANSDVLGFGPGSGSTVTEFQQRTVSTVDSATQVTLSAGVSAAKRGTAPFQTYVINLTRNVTIRGASSSLRTYVSCREVSTTVIRYAYFNFMGNGFTVGVACVDLQVHAAGAATFEYNAYDTGSANCPTFNYNTTGKTGSVTIRYNVNYSPGGRFLYLNICSFAAFACKENVIIGCTDVNASIFWLNDLLTGYDFRGNIVSGGPASVGQCFDTNDGVSGRMVCFDEMFDNCVVTHWNSGALYLSGGNSNVKSGIIRNFSAMVCSIGVRIQGANIATDVELNGCTLWGNSNAGVYVDATSNSAQVSYVRLIDCVLDGGTWQAQPRGVYLLAMNIELYMANCSLGQGGTLKTTHSSADVEYFQTNGHIKATFVDVLLGSTNKLLNLTGTAKWSDIRVQRFNGTAGDHRRDVRVASNCAWTHRVDTTIYRTASPSEKVTPTVTSTTQRAKSGVRRFKVLNGVARTVSLYARKSASGDGAAYAGNEPRLVLKANPAIGINTDTVLDTMTAGTGTWEQLTGSTGSPTDDGVVEVFVDCNGSAGWINVDDFSVV